MKRKAHFQRTFAAQASFERCGRKSKREQFLDEMIETRFNNYVNDEARAENTTQSRVRAKVEHPFRILKRIFGFDKVRYRGLKKHHNRLCACFALVNLCQHRQRLAHFGA